jgi:glycerol uptake facilitator-like aquaporin
MECIGTFFLTLVIGLTGNPLAIGLMLMAMVYVGGHVSGAHFNPAISLVAFLEKRLSHKKLFYYWLSQVIGACAALCLFMMITNNMFIPEMTPGSSVIISGSIEALFTMVFCWVFLIISTERRYTESSLQGIVIGLTLMAVAFVGGLFNPAVACGSVICNVVKSRVVIDVASVIVYVVSPLLGGLLASFAFNYFNTADNNR